MSKQRRNEIYSFKALSQPNNSQKGISDSIQSIEIQQEENELLGNNNYSNKIKSGIYRHEKMFQRSKFQPELKLYGGLNQHNTTKSPINNHNPWQVQNIQQLHPKVSSLDSQIQQNIKRRLALEQQLNHLKILQSVQNQQKTNNEYQPYLIEKQFALRNLQTDFVDQLISRGDHVRVMKPRLMTRSKEEQQQAIFKKERNQKINKHVEILNADHIQTILSNGFDDGRNPTKGFYDLNSFIEIDSNQQPNCQKNRKTKKPIKQAQTPTPPPITAIQSMLTRLTFPQVPKENIQKLLQRSLQLHAIHQPHSDIVYLLMIGSFHTGNFHDVRKYFKQILTFKKFQPKAHWIAAQAEYALGNFQRCIKLSDSCMQNLDDKYLPRFLYLKAKSYNEQGNFTNSIICYNQLIRIRPKIAEYYLQRAILYDKLGYVKECREDYLMFGILKPDAKSYLQEKIIGESNDAKRKELLQIYKMLV